MSPADERSADPCERPALDRWPTFALEHVVADGTCTIYPTDIGADADGEAWIAAAAGDRVPLDEVR
jgi:hypothetical protein